MEDGQPTKPGRMSPEPPLSPDWPAESVDSDADRAWISASLPGSPVVEGPVTVHRANAWGVTARFATRGKGSPAEAVFKANFLPQSFTGAAVYDLLHRHCPGDVPELLAWVEEPGRRWELFGVFTGKNIGSLGALEPLQEIARTLARIQSTIARLPPSEAPGVPRSPVERVPAVFDELISAIERRLLSAWQSGDTTPDAPRLPADVIERLSGARPRVARWVEELARGGWPLTAHHIDLHPDNAVRRDDGRVLIFDWEEADIGPPFFAIDKLLLATGKLAGDAGMDFVREAYLDSLPWGTKRERRRALDLALLLSPIRNADADLRFADALGWDPTAQIAGWVGLALRRWDATPS